MIAGDHDGADARSLAQLDSLFHARARRIHHADEAEERELALDLVGAPVLEADGCGVGVAGPRLLHLLHAAADREHAKCLLAEALGLLEDALAIPVGERADALVGRQLHAEREDDVDAPLHVGDLAAARVPRDDGHARPIAVEGELADLLAFASSSMRSFPSPRR